MRRVALPMAQPFMAPIWCPYPIVRPGDDPRVLRAHFEAALFVGAYEEVKHPTERDRTRVAPAARVT